MSTTITDSKALTLALFCAVDRAIAEQIRTDGMVNAGAALATLTEFERQAEKMPELAEVAHELHPKACLQAVGDEMRTKREALQSGRKKSRVVRLRMGPCDGLSSLATHLTSWMNGELYVWDGSEPTDVFIHAKTALEIFQKEDLIAWRSEQHKVNQFLMKREDSLVAEIPPWRLNAWIQALVS